MAEIINLDKARVFFPKAYFDSYDNYIMKSDGYRIEWSGEGELFYVCRDYYDRDVGYVSDDDLFNGDFDECLEYVKKECDYEI